VIAVVGSGIAGTAAALAARAAGADVTLVLGSAGATMLASGAIDDVPWEASPEVPAALDAPSRAILDALDLHAIRAERSTIATTFGIMRTARGIDRALLDFAQVRHGTVMCPEIDREGWDAPVLARAFSESKFSGQRGLVFESVPSQLLLHTSERSLPDADIAARYDDPARLAQLAERIRAVLGKHTAVLLPPWLGVEAPRADALSRAVGVPCGEIASPLASPAGLRFVRARDRALAKAGVHVISGWAASIERHGDACIVQLQEADAIRARAVVIATGGLVAGGISYTPSEALLATALPRTPRAVFASSIKGAGTLAFDGKPIGIPGSLFGTAPESLAWPFHDPAPIDRVGLLVSGDRSSAPGAFAAGDAVADEPRTFLGALRSGVRAGQSAARLSPDV
jgi:glycerol-3-phosphate dehydrogenase subunit B